jgi:transaldolase
MASNLRLCLDTADVAQWEQWHSTGLFYGVTTNPLLLERSHVPCTVDSLTYLAEKALRLGFLEVQFQTWGEGQAMVSNGLALAAIAPQVVVKVPITAAGTKAAARLIAAGVRVTLTGLYAVHQVLIAAALGAEYAAPYLGRISDLGRNGREDLAQMQRALDGVQSPTRILAASLRSPEDLAYLAAQGLNTFTISSAIATQLFEVEATAAAAADFERAARVMGA